jgi:Protein of unknown function DUF262
MHYNNIDMKIDQFISYVNENKINLIPSFQRGRVWSVATRQKLIENIVKGWPIPAIFLYRQPAGDKYTYNILDGKQRLESLILFVGDKRPALKVRAIHELFFQKRYREVANFKIEMDGANQGLKDLSERLFREFQEYVIPTIEISLSDDHPSSLDEIINLFVDINSYGVKVKRFDIVKAMSHDPLLEDAFNLLALRQERGKDIRYKGKNNAFTYVLKNLRVVASIKDANSKVDRMWELLAELTLFVRTKKHRNPVDILTSFMRVKPEEKNKHISSIENNTLRKTFNFLKEAYKTADLKKSRLATNQIHFYTMFTSIVAGNLIASFGDEELIRKLNVFGYILDEDHEKSPEISDATTKAMNRYRDLSEKQSTHIGRREDRDKKFIEILAEL